MLKFAPVCPIHIYKALKAKGPKYFGNYFLLLAHDVLAHADEYREVFHSIPKEERTIIMDNSVIELGNACTPENLFQACKIVNANVLVIPDVLEDGVHTIKALKKFYASILASDVYSTAYKEYEFMFVPQGRNQRDYYACVADAFDLGPDHFKWVGIARNLTGRVFDSRTTPVAHIQRFASIRSRKLNYHLLGFSDDVEDDFVTCGKHRTTIKGIDSAVPLRLGTRGVTLQPWYEGHDGVDKFPSAGKRGDWWNKVKATDLLAENILATHNFMDAIQGVY